MLRSALLLPPLVFVCCTLPFEALAFLPKMLPSRSWSYQALGVNSSSSNEELMKIDLRLVRLKRGEFALSGTMNWNYDVGNDTYMELTAYRSSTGSNDYKLLPFGMPRMEFYEYTNSIYRDIIIPNFADCTNFPVFEGEFEPPWPMNNYTFDSCQPKGEALPPVMLEGYYILNVSCTGKVDWTVTFLLRVEAALT